MCCEERDPSGPRDATPEVTTTTSADGRWALRFRNGYTVNPAGYGNGDWRYELVERATSRIVRAWSGQASTSPWDCCTLGVSAVRWDCDELVVVEDDHEHRINPLSLERLEKGS